MTNLVNSFSFVGAADPTLIIYRILSKASFVAFDFS